MTFVPQTQFEDHLDALHEHLTTFRGLHNTYSAYQVSYNNLLIELERRRRFRDAANRIIQEMKNQLDAIREGKNIGTAAY